MIARFLLVLAVVVSWLTVSLVDNPGCLARTPRDQVSTPIGRQSQKRLQVLTPPEIAS